MSEQVRVTSLPQCDFCGKQAHYDGKTVVGPWANMCEQHFSSHGTGLGTGRGQKFVVSDDDFDFEPAVVRKARSSGAQSLSMKELEELFDSSVFDGDPLEFL